MKLILTSLFFLLIGLYVAAEEYCNVQGVRFKKGETVPHPTICSRITCHQPPNGFSGVGCGVFVPRPGCRVSDMDNNKRYPDCCPKEICD